jgi:hypothetical protein
VPGRGPFRAAFIPLRKQGLQFLKVHWLGQMAIKTRLLRKLFVGFLAPAGYCNQENACPPGSEANAARYFLTILTG